MDKEDRIFVGLGCALAAAGLLAPAIIISSIVGGVCAVLWAFGVLS